MALVAVVRYTYTYIAHPYNPMRQRCLAPSVCKQRFNEHKNTRVSLQKPHQHHHHHHARLLPLPKPHPCRGGNTSAKRAGGGGGRHHSSISPACLLARRQCTTVLPALLPGGFTIRAGVRITRLYYPRHRSVHKCCFRLCRSHPVPPPRPPLPSPGPHTVSGGPTPCVIKSPLPVHPLQPGLPKPPAVDDHPVCPASPPTLHTFSTTAENLSRQTAATFLYLSRTPEPPRPGLNKRHRLGLMLLTRANQRENRRSYTRKKGEDKPRRWGRRRRH